MRKFNDAIARDIFEATDNERRNLEFKPGFEWNKPDANWVKEKVIRAVIGMSNTKGGGYVVIGVNEEKHRFDFKGLSSQHVASFADYEGIKGVIDSFVYGFVEFQIGIVEYNERNFVTFIVSEFEETPNLCKKNGQENGILTKDELYVRGKSSSPATIKAGDLELREIIRMAADKERVELNTRGFAKTPDSNVIEYYRTINQDLE